MTAGRSWAGSGRRTGRRSSRRSRRRSGRSPARRSTLHAAGRTDAGVHALAMTAHVDIAKAITRASGSPTGSTRNCGRCRSRSWRPRRGRRFPRPLLLHRPALSLPDRQPAGAARRSRRGGPGGCRSLLDAEAMNEAARDPGRPSRFHDLPLGPLPVGKPGQDARPADRAARSARRSRSRRRRAASSTIRCDRWSAAWSWSGAANGRQADLEGGAGGEGPRRSGLQRAARRASISSRRIYP